MTQKELVKSLKKHINIPKIKIILDYIHNNNIRASSIENLPDFENVLEFIYNMNSINKACELLFSNDEKIYRAIDSNPVQTAKFFTIYGDTYIPPLSDISVLISEKYLSLVPIEWTKKYILSNDRYYLKKHGKGYSLIDDESDYFANYNQYVNVFDTNLNALEDCQKKNMLTYFVNKLSSANL